MTLRLPALLALALLPFAAQAQDDTLKQARDLMTQSCVKSARDQASAKVTDAQVQSYCGCVSDKLITDQAALIKVGELGLRVMRKEPGAQEDMAKLAGPAALMCATKMQQGG